MYITRTRSVVQYYGTYYLIWASLSGWEFLVCLITQSIRSFVHVTFRLKSEVRVIFVSFPSSLILTQWSLLKCLFLCKLVLSLRNFFLSLNVVTSCSLPTSLYSDDRPSSVYKTGFLDAFLFLPPVLLFIVKGSYRLSDLLDLVFHVCLVTSRDDIDIPPRCSIFQNLRPDCSEKRN